MAKNNALIEKYKILYKKIQDITPEVYAGIALALSKKGWNHEEIKDLFLDSQEIWTECLNENVNMVMLCEMETGIELRNI